MKLCPKCQKQFSDDANFCPVDAARLAPLDNPSSAVDPIAARFELAEPLGGSRTGAVYRATDKTTGQPAAVKIIAPAVIALPGLAQRLERELKQLERVHTSGVAQVLASGKRGDDHWVAMELLDGAQTLGEAVGARGPMPIDKAARLICVIGEALIEAAQVGVVHRDLAPKNVVFAGDDVKLINFSLPVPGHDKAPGVPEFVAPEQHDGKPVDQRSNLYSLGALYYYVLTAQPVSVDDQGVIRPASALAEEVPAAVDAAIVRALDRSPTRRFLTVRQFIDEVARIASGEAEVRATPSFQRGGKLPAEVVDTAPGMPPDAALGTGTMLGFGIPAHAGPAHAASPERSPWAPPASDAPAAGATAGPAAGAMVMPAVVGAVPVAAVPAAPIVPPPLLAAPLLGSGKKSNKSSDPKSRFRETMWFKKGELDAEAAEAAAAEHARTGAITTDKADHLPIDERYKDDGSLSRSDKEKYSLRTGATMSNLAVQDPGASSSHKVSESALIDELKSGRNRVLAIIAAVVVAIVLLIALIVR